MATITKSILLYIESSLSNKKTRELSDNEAQIFLKHKNQTGLFITKLGYLQFAQTLGT